MLLPVIIFCVVFIVFLMKGVQYLSMSKKPFENPDVEDTPELRRKLHRKGMIYTIIGVVALVGGLIVPMFIPVE